MATLAINNEKLSTAARVSAANLLASAPYDLAGLPLAEALAPTTPGDVQLAAARALSGPRRSQGR